MALVFLNLEARPWQVQVEIVQVFTLVWKRGSESLESLRENVSLEQPLVDRYYQTSNSHVGKKPEKLQAKRTPERKAQGGTADRRADGVRARPSPSQKGHKSKSSTCSLIDTFRIIQKK